MKKCVSAALLLAVLVSCSDQNKISLAAVEKAESDCQDAQSWAATFHQDHEIKGGAENQCEVAKNLRVIYDRQERDLDNRIRKASQPG